MGRFRMGGSSGKKCLFFLYSHYTEGKLAAGTRRDSFRVCVVANPVRKKRTQPDNGKLVLTALEEGRIERVREILATLHPADIAKLLEGLPPEQRHPVWALVNPEVAGEVAARSQRGSAPGSHP